MMMMKNIVPMVQKIVAMKVMRHNAAYHTREPADDP